MKKQAAIVTANVLAAFAVGVAYEWGRKTGKAMPPLSPKEFMSGAGAALMQKRMNDDMKTKLEKLREAAKAAQEQAKARQADGQ